MFRFILFIILLLILYYVLNMILRDLPSSRKRRSTAPEELVQDPYCQTYIPKNSALRKRVHGRDLYFCGQGCFERFAKKENS